MSFSGTDVLALACILGSASVSGGATAAALTSNASRGAPCSVVDVGRGPRMVVVDHGATRVLDISPNIRVHTPPECLPVMEHQVRIRVENDQVRQEVEVRLQHELGRLEAELRSHEAELRSGEAELKARQAELEAREEALKAILDRHQG